MRALFLAIAALVVTAGTGCHGINLARHGGGDCGCTAGVPCGKPVGCTAGVSSYDPAGVSPYGPAGVSPYDPAGVSPYDPAAMDPGYGRRHHGFGDPGMRQMGPPSAQVAYPYYTIRGPRDFLIDNPPSIGR